MCNRDTKQFWRYIKSKRMDTVWTSPLKENNQLQNDSKGKAELLGSQFEFQSVITQEDTTNIPSLEGRPFPELPRLNISAKGVDKLLSQIQLKKASDPDKIPKQILKERAGTIAPYLPAIIY